MLGIVIVFGAEALAVMLSSPRQAEMAQRIETLETTRAGAVDVQDSELRRIERDLHDGAQARLVALGMSLGMAEQKLAEDPQRVGELLAEARIGAEQALRSSATSPAASIPRCSPTAGSRRRSSRWRTRRR